MVENICCEAIDCVHNLDYRCCLSSIHIDKDGFCDDCHIEEE